MKWLDFKRNKKFEFDGKPKEESAPETAIPTKIPEPVNSGIAITPEIQQEIDRMIQEYLQTLEN